MIFEWYSGSDTTLFVPKRLDEYEEQYDSMSEPERVHLLQDALGHEHDLNWRGRIRYMIGDVLFFAGAKDEAIAHFEQAEREFDPFAANFRDVGEAYCRTLYRLVEHRYFEEGRFPLIVDYGTRIIQALHGPWLFAIERSALLRMMAGAFSDLGKTPGHDWCYRIALSYYTAAHHLEPNAADLLESMVYCHFSLGDLKSCQKVYDAFLQVAARYEYKAKVDEFMRTRVRFAQ